MSAVIDDGLNTSYYGVTTYKRTVKDKWGSYSTLLEGEQIEKILDLVFSVCGPAQWGESMAQCDHHIVSWQDIGPEVCDLFQIKSGDDDGG